MAGFGNASNGSVLRVGVVTQAEVQSPASGSTDVLPLVDSDSASTWCVILVVAAIVMLYVIL